MFKPGEKPEEGRVKALRAIFEKNTAAKPLSPADFESTKAAVARHNLKYFAKTAKEAPIATPFKSVPEIPVSEKEEWVALVDDESFFLADLDRALVLGDSHAANKSVLKFFFEEFDPSRLDEVDSLLISNAGKERELFSALATAYPSPVKLSKFATADATKEEDAWAQFSDEEEGPILNGMRRPSGVWAVNYSPWDF